MRNLQVESSGVTAISKAPEGDAGLHQLFLIECDGLNRRFVEKPVEIGAGVVTLSPFQNHRRFQDGNRRDDSTGRWLDQRHELSPLRFILKYGKNCRGVQGHRVGTPDSS